MPTILSLFWRNGYEGSTLDQVAAEVGVTKPTLCRTLGDKEAIFVAAIDQYHQTYLQPAEEYLEQAATLRDALEGVLEVFGERTINPKLPAGCFAGDTAMAGDFTAGPVAETLDRHQGRLISLVQGRVLEAIESGELDAASSPMPIIQFVLGQFAALSAISRTNPTKAQIESVTHYMLAGLPWS